MLLLERVERVGLDRGRLLEGAQLREDDLADPETRVPETKHWRLWQEIVRQRPDETLGIRIGSGFRIRQAGLVGYAMLHSRDLGHAIQRLIRYERIMADTTVLSLATVGGRVQLTVEEPVQLTGLRQPIEYDLATIVTCLREITATQTIPLEVHLPYPRPAVPEDYRRVLGESLQFDQQQAAIVFEAASMDLPVVARDDTLCRYLDRYAEQILGKLAAASFSERVQRVLWEQLSEGQPSLTSVASALAVSPRTLQRRLQEEGATFGELLEDFRRNMAVDLLGRADLAVYEVAFVLGYSDPSTFYRAFRRWNRTSPREFRRSSLATGAENA